ncbi:hypothetical protein DSECCO2_617260 [anaerobic digester metagenome]
MFDGVDQFADVAGPVVGAKPGQGGFLDAPEGQSEFTCQPFGVRPGQGVDVVPPLAQGRDVDADHVQAIQEVRPETALGRLLLQVLVCGGDDLHVHGDGAPTADPHDLPVLQHTQQIDLHGQRHLADLVQKQGARVGQFELAGTALAVRAGEGAAGVAEEFALDQFRGDGSAVHGHEGAAGAAAFRVDAAGEQLLARAGLARQQHGGWRARGLEGQADGPGDGRALAEDASQALPLFRFAGFMLPAAGQARRNGAVAPRGALRLHDGYHGADPGAVQGEHGRGPGQKLGADAAGHGDGRCLPVSVAGQERAVVEVPVRRLPLQGSSGHPEQRFGGDVGVGDEASAVDGDHAGQHRVEGRGHQGPRAVFEFSAVLLEEALFEDAHGVQNQGQGQGVVPFGGAGDVEAADDVAEWVENGGCGTAPAVVAFAVVLAAEDLGRLARDQGRADGVGADAALGPQRPGPEVELVGQLERVGVPAGPHDVTLGRGQGHEQIAVPDGGVDVVLDVAGETPQPARRWFEAFHGQEVPALARSGIDVLLAAAAPGLPQGPVEACDIMVPGPHEL